MDLENPESYKNKPSNNSHLYRDNNLRADERSSLFNLNGTLQNFDFSFKAPLTQQNLPQFLSSLEKTKSVETQVEFLTTLNKSNLDIIDKFCQIGGIASLCRQLALAAHNLPTKAELADRILLFLGKITISKDILTKTRIHHTLENLRNATNVSEELGSKSWKLLVKWKDVIDEWTQSGGEKEAVKYRREEALKGMIGTSEQIVVAPDLMIEMVTDSKKKLTILDPHKKGRRREDQRRRGRNDDDEYLRKRRHRDSHDDDRSSDYSDDYYDKKSVHWVDDPRLTAIKYFRSNDEPAHPPLSEEEVKKIQDELMERFKNSMGNTMGNNEDIKHRESQMEANSMKQKKDNEREIQEKLNAMNPSIEWATPFSIITPKGQLLEIKLPDDIVEVGSRSLEKKELEGRLENKLPAVYMKEYQIPDHPSFDSVSNKSPLADRPIIIPLCSADGDDENEKKPEEKKAEVSKVDTKKPAKPLKGILRKSKKDEGELDKAEKPKPQPRKRLNLDPGLVLKIINGESTPEERGIHTKQKIDFIENFAKTLKESGRSDDIIKNISIIQKFMDNVQKIKALEKSTPVATTSTEPRKLIKTNDEPEPNLLRSHSHHEQVYHMGQHQQFHPQMGHQMQQPFHQMPSQDQLQSNVYYDMQAQAGGGSPSDPNKKVSYKPHNYKTVPCVFFHSGQGCSRGETCHFIHDWNFQGKETPNMRKYVRNTMIKDGKEVPIPEGMGNFLPTMEPQTRPPPTHQPMFNMQQGHNQGYNAHGNVPSQGNQQFGGDHRHQPHFQHQNRMQQQHSGQHVGRQFMGQHHQHSNPMMMGGQRPNQGYRPDVGYQPPPTHIQHGHVPPPHQGMPPSQPHQYNPPPHHMGTQPPRPGMNPGTYGQMNRFQQFL